MKTTKDVNMTTHTRYHYIDNLRTIALLLGIVFHAALAYGASFQNIWLTSDVTNHIAFDFIAKWTHLFRMPLFFVIAGFCGALLVNLRGENSYLFNRFKRVFLPFLVFLPIILGSTLAISFWAASFVQYRPPIFELFELVESPSISTMHLWFLFNLFQFCCVFWLLSKWQSGFQAIMGFISRPIFLIAVLPFVVGVSMSQQMIPFPPPDKLFPQLWSYGFYGVLFLVGASLFHHHSVIQRYEKQLVWLLVIAVVSSYFYFSHLPAPLEMVDVVKALNNGGVVHVEVDAFLVVMQTLTILSWTAVCYLSGYKWLNKRNNLSRYLSDASYWVYLIHLPILMIIQFVLINTSFNVFIKFNVSILVTFALSILSYHFFVRSTFIGTFLNGKKHSVKGVNKLA